MSSEGTRIDFERSGGFAGISLAASVDTASLAPDEAREIEQLLEKIDFDALRQRPPRATRGADRFQYNLTASVKGARQNVSIGEAELTPELRALVERLTEIARRP
jgi:hypothetical protein